MTTEQIRLLLVGDHSLLQIGIKTLLANTIEDVTLVGTAADSKEAVALYPMVQPDVLVFAPTVLLRSQIVKQLIQECPATRVLIIQVDKDETRLKKLVDSGVSGCFLHSDPPEKFVDAIRTVAQGRPWFSHSLYTKFVNLEMDSMACGLTDQELDVLRLVVAEKTDREIAQAVNLSERNVRRILRCIYDKVGVNSRVGAAFQAGMVGFLAGNGQNLGRI